MSDFSVSINIPTYNQENFIQRAITSALKQDCENLMVNVLDDASSDETFKKAKLIEAGNLNVFRNERNLGRVKTYHKLLFEIATGKWVVNLDGDDYFTSSRFISEGKKWIEQFPTEQISFFQANHLNLDAVTNLKTAVKLDDQTCLVDGTDYLKNYHKIKSFDHFATLYNRELAIKAGFYKFDSLNTDFNSVMKLCLHGKIIISSLKIGLWNFNSQSETNRIFENDNFNSYIEAVKELAEYSSLRLSPGEVKTLKKNLIRLTKNYLFMIAIKKGSIRQAGAILIDNANFSVDYIRCLLKFVRITVLSIVKKKK